ncbi:MAG: ArnT family glycosyltransferase [Myxococcales bacterium]
MSGRRWAVLCLALALRCVSASTPVLHDWDERYHALVAVHLLEHPLTPTLLPGAGEKPAEEWMAAGVFLHKPPLALWAMALGRAAFGNHEWAFRAASVAAGVGTVALTLSLGAELCGESVGLLAGLLVALSPELLYLASGFEPTDHVDAQLAFWVTASALALWRCASRPGWRNGALAALSLGGGLLTKSWPALAAVPAALVLAWPSPRARRWSAASVAGGLALAEPWRLYAASRWPATFASESAYALRHFTRVLEGHDGSYLFFPALIGRWGGPAALLAAGWIAWRARRQREALFLALWLLLPLAIFDAAATKMVGYLAPELPALAIGSAWFAREAWSHGGATRRLLAASVPLWAVGAAALALPRTLERPPGYGAFRARALALSKSDRIFNLRWAVQAMVYSGAWATADWPSSADASAAWVARCPASPPPPPGFRPLDLPAGACQR